MKKIIKKFFKYFGYEITRPVSSFSSWPDLKWLKDININAIFDIGANEGQFARFIHAEFPQSIIYSFEPIEDCYNKLLLLTKEIKNLIPFNYALGEANAIVPFYVNDFSPSSSLLKMNEEHVKNFPFTKKSSVKNVTMKKLDNIIEKIVFKKEVMVKIDVQGFEYNVLKGGEEFFKNIPKIVIVETSLRTLYENESTFDEIYDMFKTFGYVYSGNLNQLYSPIDGSILQADAIFMRTN